MIRNSKQWQSYFEDNYTGGYVAGGDGTRFYELCEALFTRVKRDIGNHKLGRVLDIGCANGRIPVSLDALEVEFTSYLGVDVNPRAIQFCNDAFPDARFSFSHANVNNRHYVNSQKQPIQSYRIPGDNYDTVIANSLFTHLGEPKNARYYLKEVSRVISHSGIFYSTWFRNPPYDISHEEAMCVYPEQDILDWMGKAGFVVVESYGGDTKSKANQWRLVCKIA